MWKCPKCNAQLVHRNLSHSCGKYTVEGFLAGKPARGKELFLHLVKEFEKLGTVTLHPVKTRIALMVDVRFAAIYKIAADHIDGHLWLKQRFDHPRFRRIEHLGKDDFVHHFRISDESDLDTEFRRAMKMAYAIGERRHVAKRD
jgi:hypothetical protein